MPRFPNSYFFVFYLLCLNLCRQVLTVLVVFSIHSGLRAHVDDTSLHKEKNMPNSSLGHNLKSQPRDVVMTGLPHCSSDRCNQNLSKKMQVHVLFEAISCLVNILPIISKRISDLVKSQYSTGRC